MADRFVFGSLVVTGLLSLAACTSVQTASDRQTYFETASAARLAWQPIASVPTSFQGCEWGSANYPCQPHTKLDSPEAATHAPSLTHKDAVKVHKPVYHKRGSSHAKAHQPLPLCQPVTSSPVATPFAVTTSATNQTNSNPIVINPRSSS